MHVPVDEAALFLASEPVSMLPLSAEDIEQLQLLGIQSCGQFASLPRHAVEAQFGSAGGIAWLAARGEDPRPVRPRPWERERVVEHVQAEPPLVSREAILHGVEQTHVTPKEREALGELMDTGLHDLLRERWPRERMFSYWDYRAGMFHQELKSRLEPVKQLVTPWLPAW